MKEIVEQVLKEEEEGRLRLEQAKAEAERLLIAAQAEAEALLRDATVKAEEEARGNREKAEKAYLSERDVELTAAQQESESWRSRKEKDIGAYARKILSRILAIGE